jgi:hypothetical protein
LRQRLSVGRPAGAHLPTRELLAEEGLDDATEFAVREQLDALATPGLSEEEQREGWERVKRAAPGLVQRGQNIIEGLVAAAIRQQIGL